MDVADYAAQAGLPVIRFTSSDAALNPAFERPSVIVITGTDDPACTDVSASLYSAQHDESAQEVVNSTAPACLPRLSTILDAERLRFRSLEDIPELEAAILRAWRQPPAPPGACALLAPLQNMVLLQKYPTCFSIPERCFYRNIKYGFRPNIKDMPIAQCRSRRTKWSVQSMANSNDAESLVR